MQQPRRRNRVILGVLALGLLAGGALTAHPAQAVDAVGPYYALPSWDQKIGAATRFVVLTDWNSQAVLDKETGLVWEKTPSITGKSWVDARHHCTNDTATGTRKGWRLPSISELASVIDPSLPAPFVPASIFTGVQSANYWSAATIAGSPTLAWSVYFGSGDVFRNVKTGTGLAWCVRGGMNADAY